MEKAEIFASLDIDQERFTKSLGDQLEKHHQVYKMNACKGELLEEAVCWTILEQSASVDYPFGGHQRGSDIYLNSKEQNIGISCKSGKFFDSTRSKYNGCLEISGYRTQSAETLEEKIDLINDNHEDYVFTLSSPKNQRTKQNKQWLKGEELTFTYMFNIFPASLIKFDSTMHNDRGTMMLYNKEYGPDILSGKIIKKCSDQLWFKAHEDLIGKPIKTYEYKTPHPFG